MTTHFRSIADIRRDYGELNLDEHSLPADPIVQFQLWFADVLRNETSDPTAMVLSTVDPQGRPDSRVVLLKGLEHGHFIFYTNYQSAKGAHIQNKSYVALNFYWPQMARQVRVRGKVKKCNKEQSDSYFSSRPLKSQYSAMISPQSHEIANREVLEKNLHDLMEQNHHAPITRPDYWGGYEVFPEEIEFWQGRDSRLHDRIHYYKDKGEWKFHRLAP